MNIAEWFESRHALRRDFLLLHGWGDADLIPVGEDGAFRRYFRLHSPGKPPVILMEAVPEGNALATPGHSIRDFIRLGAYLRGIGVSAPETYVVDEAQGFVLLEDFGDISFKRAWNDGIAARDDLYALATDVLGRLRREGRNYDIALPAYYDSHVHTGRRRVIDWYVPAVRGVRNPDGLVESYLAVWDGIERSLPPVPCGFLHIDYHFENLMLVPGKDGLARCGVLDFQGAMTGPLPYDLANLLEDARVDVPADLRAMMMERYCRDMGREEREIFQAWYRVLATQFHCRVIGQFIRLAIRDGKPRYLPMIPRLGGYIRNGLKDPVLAPLAAWFKAQDIRFDEEVRIDPVAGAGGIPAWVRADAF